MGLRFNKNWWLSIDFKKLERLIQNKYISKTSVEKNSIKFLTIQKSKGLEFDYVIIPNLNRGSKNSESDLILYDKTTLSIKNPLNGSLSHLNKEIYGLKAK